MLMLPNATDGSSYGWINRAIPDAELDDFVDRFARRYPPLTRRHSQKLRDRSTEHPAFLIMHNLPLLGQLL
jgi:hypothetical protein